MQIYVFQVLKFNGAQFSVQELFNFFDFHGTGLISHQDLKQVLGQEPLGFAPLGIA